MESSASAGRVASAVLDPRRWWALALLCGAFFMVLLDGTITIVALPSIGAGLRFPKQGLQWVLSACALTFGDLLLLGGRAADLLGRRRVFMAGGWVGLIGNSPQLAKLALDEALAAGAFLLGRRTYEWLAVRWPSRSGELADRLNSLPKYVVSATLANPAWNNSTVLKGDVLNEVSTLKQHIDGDIVIAGSFQLVRTLIKHDLVDELRLKIFPVTLGVGERLFGETSGKKPMRLTGTQTLEGGIAYLTYQSVRDG